MDNIKPWQIILIVLALLVLGFSVWRQVAKSRVDLPDSVLVVDVQSGSLYRMRLGKRNGAYFPERHPDTGELSLMPVVEDDEGVWYVVPHARPTLEDITVENQVVNTETWVVEIASEDVIQTLNAGR